MEPTIQVPDRHRGRRFDPVRDLTWIVGQLQVRGELRAAIDQAHARGLALEEWVEERFNRITGAATDA